MTVGNAAGMPVDAFAALSALPEVRHGFTCRAPGLVVREERVRALQRLDVFHTEALRRAGLESRTFITCEQVHGRCVAAVTSATPVPVPGVDGLVTSDPSVCLGIYAADCCAVYLVDPQRRVIALLHSGRRGSEAGIAGEAIGRMRADFGCDPAEMVAQFSPCIRYPNYEVDFAAMIVEQCREAGVGHIEDCGICTASHLDRYYSYRAEKGKTGRMLAFLALA